MFVRRGEIVCSLEDSEIKIVNRFVAGVKRMKVGYEKRIFREKIIDGFKSKGQDFDYDKLDRIVYHIQIRGLVPKMLYDGVSVWIADNDDQCHNYINSLWKWADDTEDKTLEMLLRNVCRAINKQVLYD